MSIKIYNSLTKKKEEFKPLRKNEVGIYVCGPTVYDEPHIGHARSAYIFDVIRRYFEYKKYKVKFVRNVTDVDDKIINRARKEFRGQDLNIAVKRVADKYLNSYRECMADLGIRPPDVEPKATEYIEKMIRFIAKLIKRGVAYQADGDVYFDIRQAKKYGKLSHQTLGAMESGIRVAAGENKKNPLDFALWKRAKEQEPFWDSPWGKGRPGWHIECSVMSSDILGDEFDIHAGGIDLIFPHHENEIAQSEGAGKKFARYWIHNGLLSINGQKMAKSLGNFVTVKEILERRYPLDALKLLFLQSHYSHPVDFSWEIMEAKREALKKIIEFLYYVEKEEEGGWSPRPKIPDINNKLPKLRERIDRLRSRFERVMDDDFGTPRAVSILFSIVNLCNKIWCFNTYNRDEHISILTYAKNTIKEFGEILGLSFEKQISELRNRELTESQERDIKRLIEKREEFRKQKDFKNADKIRKELEEKGIILEDTKEGTTWRRKL